MTRARGIRTGVVLPTFRETPDGAFEVAARAVEADVDGVFCYDHIWPLGQPERPALAPFPVLGALATRLSPLDDGRGGPFLGTLVARVGLVPNGVLTAQFTALDRLAPGRVIAGLGTGDHQSEAENRAYGIPFPSASERRAALVELGRALVARSIVVWVAGGKAARTQEAEAVAAALNVWDAGPALVADRVAALARNEGLGGAAGLEVTWAGSPPGTTTPLARTVDTLRAAGASWAVFGWPVDLEELGRAGRASPAP